MTEQLLAMTTLVRLVSEATRYDARGRFRQKYAEAIATYLGDCGGLGLADYNATACTRWGNDVESSHNARARQALPMVWDYADVNPIGDAGGSWSSLLTGPHATA